MTRREFVKLGGLLAAAAGLGRNADVFAAGLEKLATRQVKVVWLQGLSCSGCSVSLLNSDDPGVYEVLTGYISLVLHQTVGAAQGRPFMDVLDAVAKEGRYILVVEGSVPMGMPEACMLGGRPFVDILEATIARAKYVVAAGTCAAFGGIPAAEGNPTGAASVKAFMESRHLPVRNILVNCGSCPCHPDSIVGTLAWLAGRGYPEVHPELLTPNMYYLHSTHDNCPRYHDYHKQVFAKSFGDTGCLFKLGCLGFLAHTECPRRQWNGGVNWCVRAGAPCIACSSQLFAKYRDFPFYRKGEQYRQVAYAESARKGE